MYIFSDQRYKTSITSWYNNIADTAGVVAHEIGHALGMNHDFIDSTGGDRYDNNGVKCTDINGVMDYGSRPAVDKFSTCSKQDFRDYYNRVLQTNNEFCMTCGKILSFVNIFFNTNKEMASPGKNCVMISYYYHSIS